MVVRRTVNADYAGSNPAFGARSAIGMAIRDVSA